jgi:hypothetical protein
MAHFDDGRHSDNRSTIVIDTHASLSHITSPTRTIRQETALSSSPSNPTHQLVGRLQQDSTYLKTPRPHHHRVFAPFRNALPPIIDATPVHFDDTLPSLTTAAPAVCILPQQAFSGFSPSTGPTYTPVQDLQRDTELLKHSNKPRRSAAPIRHWLPCSFQDSCFCSIGGQFLSFPGFNSLLPVTLLHPITPFTHKCAPKSPNSAIDQQVAATRTTTTIDSLEIRLLHLEKKMKEMHTILCTLALEIRQCHLSEIPPAPLHNVVTTILPLVTAVSQETTVNSFLSQTKFNLHWNHQRPPLFFTYQQSRQPNLFSIAIAPIGLRPPPEPPPAVFSPATHKKNIERLPVLPSCHYFCICPLAFSYVVFQLILAPVLAV